VPLGDGRRLFDVTAAFLVFVVGGAWLGLRLPWVGLVLLVSGVVGLGLMIAWFRRPCEVTIAWPYREIVWTNPKGFWGREEPITIELAAMTDVVATTLDDDDSIFHQIAIVTKDGKRVPLSPDTNRASFSSRFTTAQAARVRELVERARSGG
jgi:hypothetical protein